jgi:hypothetical protein
MDMATAQRSVTMAAVLPFPLLLNPLVNQDFRVPSMDFVDDNKYFFF